MVTLSLTTFINQVAANTTAPPDMIYLTSVIQNLERSYLAQLTLSYILLNNHQLLLIHIHSTVPSDHDDRTAFTEKKKTKIDLSQTAGIV